MNTPPVRFVRVDPSGFQRIADLAHRIWPASFASIISAEQCAYMLHQRYSPEGFARAVAEGMTYEFIQKGDDVVGFGAQGPGSNNGEWKLWQVYLLPDQQGRGTGRKYLEHVIRTARLQGRSSVVLTVNRGNHRALALYERFGFRLRESAVFDIGGGFFMDDHVLEKRLDEPSKPFRTPTLSAIAVSLAILGASLSGMPALAADPYISEVVSQNHAGLRDEQGAHPDWIELHNPGETPVDLAGWSLSDDAGRPRRWTFTGGSIPAGESIVIFASGLDLQPIAFPARAPDQIPGLALWMRADAIDVANPQQVRHTSTADFVATWPDASGLNRHARQTRLDWQPRFVAGPNAAVRFDGSDDLLRMAAPPATDSFTLFAVFQPTRAHEVDPAGNVGVGGTSGQAWLFGADHGGDAGAGMGLSVGTNGVSVYEHGSSYMPAVVTFEGSLAGSRRLAVVTYSNRVAQLAVDGIPGSPGPPSSRTRVTAPTGIGSGSYGAFAGDISEIIAYGRALTDEERSAIETHLAARHGVVFRPVYHTNFRIDADGERLVLTRPDGSRADDVRVPALPRDVSWGRPEGSPGLFRFFAEPTPGHPNPAEGAVAFLAAPTFDFPPGFYPTNLEVSLRSTDPSVEIRYTTDGSEPLPSSALYTGAIPVTNRASLPNRISAIPTAPGWSAPSGRVFKGTVLRARAFRADALPSPTATASYFIHPRGRERYALPVVSLATDERHFFSPETGIYVVGLAPGGNYAQSGDAWERPVHVELFEPDGTRPIAEESGVRMHGNTSFGFPIKALRLHPLNQRGTGPFRHRIFPDLPIESFNRLLLRPSGHDHYLTMMRDGLMQGLMRETGLDMQGYRPAILFLNGEYWGIHNLQEAFEKEYFESHHPEVDADAVDYLEGYAPGAFAYEGDAQHYHDLVRYLESHSLADPTAYEWAGARMDVANFRDYKLAEIFYYRWDIGNHRLWRPRTDDGRLRWILFDCDVGFGGFWSEPNPWTFNMLRAVLEPTGTLHGHNNAATVFLLKALLRNPLFQREFINRGADLMNTTLSPARMLDFIDRMAAEIAPEMAEHTLRWRAPSNLAEWQRRVDELRNFARQRPLHMRQHFASQFGLPGTSEVTLHPPQPDIGRLRLNSIDSIPASGGPWKGFYFRGVPIELEAVPRAGFRFAGWLELPGLTNNPLTLTLTGDFTLTPEFGPISPARFEIPNRLDDGSLRLRWAHAPPGAGALESSSDLRTWRVERAVPTDTQGRGSADVRVDGPTGGRFYRLSGPP
ncbi:MAG: GNAT family N-acetyltransferase [Limisphaerales bacterium]